MVSANLSRSGQLIAGRERGKEEKEIEKGRREGRKERLTAAHWAL